MHATKKPVFEYGRLKNIALPKACQGIQLHWRKRQSYWQQLTLLIFIVVTAVAHGLWDLSINASRLNQILGPNIKRELEGRYQTAHIVDYKTGSTDAKKTARPTEKNPLGGLYRRQLIFYKILYELHQSTYKSQSAEISYLEPDPAGDYITKNLEYNVQELELVKGFITDSYQKIMNQEFYEGCGEKNCQWCNFVKQNIPPESLIDYEAEALDD